QDLKVSLKNDRPLLLDVRTPTEWKGKHIEGARHIPLATFGKQPSDLPNDRPIAIICGSGYRSSIATSMLQVRGYERVENATGGMAAFTEAEQ
ncbi:MAG: rhodanese-like domain-containing protein, partial [Chthoniobacterales bacterium]